MGDNGRMDRLEADLAQLTGLTKTIAEATIELIKRSDQHDEQIKRLDQRADRDQEMIRQLKEIADRHDEHFGVLIRMMDEWIRDRGKDKE